MASVAEHPPSRIWLHGPVSDLLWGCGVGYLILLGVLLGTGESLRLAQPAVLFPVLVMLISMPHYGATLLRVYEQRRDRRAYALFSVWASAAVLAWFVASLWSPVLGTAMVTLYLTWSPWHYTGQNYGIAVTFLRRSGVALDATTKQWLYASFILSFFFVAIVMHTGEGTATYFGQVTESPQARFLALGIPPSFSNVVLPLLLAGYLGTSGVAAWRLTRTRRLRELTPVALISVSQMLWFVVPLFIKWVGWSSRAEALNPEWRTHYFVWIALAHSGQYLWVTSYFARKSGRYGQRGAWYGKALASGAAIWTFPLLVCGPLVGGPLSVDMGLATLLASAVNIHHFVLDGAIWKLRGRIADLLIRNVPNEEAVVRPTAWRKVVWAGCACAIALNSFEIYNRNFDRGSLPFDVRSRALDRLAWFGLDAAKTRAQHGAIALRDGDTEAALENFTRLVSLRGNPQDLAFLGQAQVQAGDWEGARDSLAIARAAFPKRARLHASAAWALFQLGRFDEAVELIELAARLSPQDPLIQRDRRRILSGAAESRETRGASRSASG